MYEVDYDLFKLKFWPKLCQKARFQRRAALIFSSAQFYRCPLAAMRCLSGVNSCIPAEGPRPSLWLACSHGTSLWSFLCREQQEHAFPSNTGPSRCVRLSFSLHLERIAQACPGARNSGHVPNLPRSYIKGSYRVLDGRGFRVECSDGALEPTCFSLQRALRRPAAAGIPPDRMSLRPLRSSQDTEQGYLDLATY